MKIVSQLVLGGDPLQGYPGYGVRRQQAGRGSAPPALRALG